MTHIRSNAEKGNVLFYILLCVILLAAISFVLTQGSGDSASGIQASQLSEEIKTQAQTIRSALLECNLVHNYGYPAQPVSGLVADLRCQTDDVPNYEDIFSGTSNRIMPQTPKPFTTGWEYVVDGSTTPPSITIELTDAIDCTANRGLQSAIEILKTQYQAAEIETTCDGTTASFKLYIVKGS